MNIPDTDNAVIDRVRAGDSEAFGVLVGRYNQRLFRIARSILSNRADAEDALQQAYVQAYVHLGQFDGRSAFSTWLTRIVIREATARGQKERRVSSPLDSIASALADTTRSPADWAEHQEASSALEVAIDSLVETYRSVFVLREVHGLTTAETAQDLDLTEDVVKVRFHRAKAHLRTHLGQLMDARQPDAFIFLGADCEILTVRVMKAISLVSAN